jgi:hypothetical protein
VLWSNQEKNKKKFKMQNLKAIGTQVLIVVVGVIVANAIQQRMNKAKLTAPASK